VVALAGLGEGPLPRSPEALGTEPLHRELQPSLGGVVDIAVGDEDVDEGFGGGERVGPRHEVGQLDGQRGGLS
jgi:hypothetical protein